MKRLFVFAIGGTGSRVLKSLAMLLAAGVRSRSSTPYEVVPIIIDPHKSNDDLKRTMSILNAYEKIADHVSGGSSRFFNTKIRTLDRIGVNSSPKPSTFTFELQQVASARFKNYVALETMSDASRALTEVLFSGDTVDQRGRTIPLIDVEMDIGFVGNPNIGSVVLNQFAESQEFKEFANNFKEGDRVFIISSIFGGTGAAGFPVVLKNLRDAGNSDLDGRSYLKNAIVGALTVMPYFNIESDKESPIRRSDFVSKTKAALSYYKRNVTGNNSLNALYYIADNYQGAPYKNDPGTGGQQNDAHFVEVASALAVIDFMGLDDRVLETINGKATKPIFREFAVRNAPEKLIFSDLHDESERMLSVPLSKLYFMFEYLRDPRFELNEKQHPWRTDAPAIDNTFLSTPFYRSHLSHFGDHFFRWLEELSRNRRGFAPLSLGNITNPIVGKAPKKSLFSSFTYDHIDGELNKQTKKNQYHTPEQKLLSVFDSATTELLSEFFAMKG
jgi:hypothetical protein